MKKTMGYKIMGAVIVKLKTKCKIINHHIKKEEINCRESKFLIKLPNINHTNSHNSNFSHNIMVKNKLKTNYRIKT